MVPTSLMTTQVIQSHRSPLPFSWLETCINTVELWAEQQKFDYHFVGDDLFNYLPADIALRSDLSLVIKSDLARLRYLQAQLQHCQRVVWFDADVLIFNPQSLDLPQSSCLIGRENWPQLSVDGKLKNYRKVHNAAMSFGRNDSFLAFYADTAERFLRENTSAMPPQFIGPKLLTALHNVVQLPVWGQVGMLSPSVAYDILQKGDGHALDMLRYHQAQMCAINLCSSSVVSNELSSAQMRKIIEILLVEHRV
jgi:hypothetical protein